MEEDVFLNDGRVDVSDEGLIYWADKINCDLKDLKDAVSKIGDKYKVLVLFLQLNRKIKNE